MSKQLNTAFYNVWGGQKQADLSCFIKPHYEKPNIPLFNHHNVNSILVKLKPKSTGPDNLSPKLLKSTRFELCDIIVYLGNLSIDTSTAPTQNKHPKITASNQA